MAERVAPSSPLRAAEPPALRASAPLGLGADALSLHEITDRALVTIVVSEPGVRLHLERAFGAALPAVGESVATSDGLRLLGLQSDRLHVMFDTGTEAMRERSSAARADGTTAALRSDAEADPEGWLRERIDAAATPGARSDPDATATGVASDTEDASLAAGDESLLYSSDQSDSWVMLRLDGPASRRALERVCPLDLHPDAYPLGAVARSVVEHLGVIVLREGEDAFLLLSPRSSARSFLHEIETSINNVRGAP